VYKLHVVFKLSAFNAEFESHFLNVNFAWSHDVTLHNGTAAIHFCSTVTGYRQVEDIEANVQMHGLLKSYST